MKKIYSFLAVAALVTVLSFTFQSALPVLNLYGATEDTVTLVNYQFESDTNVANGVSDSSGSGNNGTVTGGTVTFSGGAASFEGGYIKMPNGILMSALTFSVSMKIKTSTNAGGVLLGYQKDPARDYTDGFIPMLFINTDGKLHACVWAGGAELVVVTPNAINDGSWHTIDLFVTSSSSKLYVDSTYIGGDSGKNVNHFGMAYNQLGEGYGSSRIGDLTNKWYPYFGLMDYFKFVKNAAVVPAVGTSPVIATLLTNDATSLASTSATLNGNITDNGGSDVTGRGFVYSSTDSTPTIGEAGVTKVTSGSGTGTFNNSLTGLSSGVTYYCNAYAENMTGTSYGGVKSFATLGSNTATVTSGTYTVSSGGTASETITGVPYNTSKATFLASLTKGNASQTWNSSGISDPAVSGNTLVVTSQDSSTTVTYTLSVSSAAATLVTNDATNLASTSATLNGNITADGGATITGRGFVYSSTDSTPTIGESGVSQVSSDSGTGSFNVIQSGLSIATIYYYRAYAINSVGTSYGVVKSFTTLSGSTVATVTSGTYTASSGGTASETITGVPHNTSKASFLASLTKGNDSQTWNSSGISDPAVSGNTLVVTAQDGSTTVTYTITVNSASENTPAPKIFTKDEMVANNLTILEQVRLYGATNSGFVEMLYDNILNRIYDGSGYSNWTDLMLGSSLSGSEVAYRMIFSEELAPAINSLVDNAFITFLYRVVLDRPYDEPGYANWQQQIDLGMTREELVNHFISSEEFVGICKLFNVTP